MIPGIEKETVVFILWALAILVLAWTWIPAFIASLGGVRFVTGGSNETSRLELSKNGPDFQFWAKQLLALGYEPIGSGFLRVNFAGPHWALISAIAIYHNASKNSYAYMERAPAPYSFWPGAAFATIFTDDTMLISDNNRAVDPDPEDECIRQGIVTLDLKQLEDFHQATLEALKKLKHRPETDQSVEALLAMLNRFDGRDAKRVHSRAGTQYLFAHVLIHVCVSLPTFVLLGFDHWAVPTSNLILAIAMLTGERAQKKQYAQQVRMALGQKLRQ